MRVDRSQVTAGFVKTVVSTPLENEMCKKKRTKKNGRSVFPTVCHHNINKKIDVSTEQHYIAKFYITFKKVKVEMITLLKEAFQILVVSVVEM